MNNYIFLYDEYLTGRGLKDTTIKRKTLEVKRFFQYLTVVNISDIRDVNDKIVEEYFIFIDKSVANSTKIASLSSLRDFFFMLKKYDKILVNPFERVEIAFKEKSGFKVILTESEMIRFLDAIETRTGYGLRDRTLFEVMYIAGLRVSELINLNVEDIDFNQNEVLIRQGKGRKDRIVPIGKISKDYLERWIKKARGWFLGEKDKGALFINRVGKRISDNTVRFLLKKYLKLAGIEKEGVTPHSIRHSCATHLLQYGADIRFVQSLLGHESIETTVTYTKDIVSGLKKMHKSFHPRENEIFTED